MPEMIIAIQHHDPYHSNLLWWLLPLSDSFAHVFCDLHVTSTCTWLHPSMVRKQNIQKVQLCGCCCNVSYLFHYMICLLVQFSCKGFGCGRQAEGGGEGHVHVIFEASLGPRSAEVLHATFNLGRVDSCVSLSQSCISCVWLVWFVCTLSAIFWDKHVATQHYTTTFMQKSAWLL